MQEQLFLDAIRAEPEARENYLVYGDWLAQRGDPRGELIGVQLALEREPANAELHQRAHELATAQLAELPGGIDVTWKCGFVSEVRLPPDEAALEVLGHPLLQLIEAVSFVDRESMFQALPREHHMPLLARMLKTAPTQLLRRIEIGHTNAEVFPGRTSLQRVLERCPRLTELTLHAMQFPEGAVEVLSPVLRSFELASLEISDKQLREIASATWPHLRALTLHVQHRVRDAARPTPLAKLMSGRGFPALVDLRVREHPRVGGFTERFCLDIVKAPLLARLEVLDFTARGLDVDIVRPSYPKLRHLKTLLPSAESETDTEALQQLTFFLEEPDTERAIALSRRVLEFATSDFDRHNMHRRLGVGLTLIGRLDEAMAAYEASLAADPDCGATLLHKAITLKRMGRFEKAEVTLRAAIAAGHHSPNSRSARYLRASLDRALGTPRARQEIELVRLSYLEALPTHVVDADVHYELACLHALLGDTPNAIAMLKAAIALCPHLKEWARTEVDFDGLRRLVRFRRVIEA